MVQKEQAMQTMTGTLLRPLAVGAKAVILHQGQITLTSRVVEIHSRTEDEIRFETLNTQYRLLTGPCSEPAADCFSLAMAA